MRFLKALPGSVALTFALAAPVLAQSYPGTTAAPAATTQTAGTLAVGQQTTIASGGFAPGPVTITVNGRPGASDTAGANGVVNTTVAVLGVSLVRVEGVQFAANCVGNTISVTGPSATGGSRTVNTTFNIACPAAAAGGLLPRTGGAILAWSLGGAALLAGGSLLVVSNRRRRSSAPAS